METKVLSVYADGGVIRVNPSPIGGTWAYVHVEDGNQIIRKAYGVMAPSSGIGGCVTNNVSELFALCRAILAIPTGTQAHIYSDSQCSLLRVFKSAKMNQVPDWLVLLRHEAAEHLQCLDGVQWTLLDGHPTKAQLLAGVGKRGGPVSWWNVWADSVCQQEAQSYLAKNKCEVGSS